MRRASCRALALSSIVALCRGAHAHMACCRSLMHGTPHRHASPQQPQQPQQRWWPLSSLSPSWWRRRRKGGEARTRHRRHGATPPPTAPHRVARRHATWWRNAALLCGLLLVINGSAMVYYALYRAYYAWRPRGDDVRVLRTIDERLFARPDLAVAAVRMALHHALCEATTPFGCPLVAPASCAAEAEALCDMLWALHTAHPRYSVADLWAVTTARALARLGGPRIDVRYGRQDRVDDTDNNNNNNNSSTMSRARMLAYTPARVCEDVRDVRTLRRVLAAQGMTPAQTVALVGCMRSLGYHDAAHVHTTATVTPALPFANSTTSSRQRRADDDDDAAAMPQTVDKCTCDPYVFSSVYFDLLLDYNWHRDDADGGGSGASGSSGASRSWWRPWPHRRTAAATTSSCRDSDTHARYRCFADDRRRTITLVVPPDDRGRARAAAASRADVTSHNDSDADSHTAAAASSSSFDPCAHVRMRNMDVMLLDDALTRGWVMRFSDSEPEFAAAVAEVMRELQTRGHPANELRAVH